MSVPAKNEPLEALFLLDDIHIPKGTLSAKEVIDSRNHAINSRNQAIGEVFKEQSFTALQFRLKIKHGDGNDEVPGTRHVRGPQSITVVTEFEAAMRITSNTKPTVVIAPSSLSPVERHHLDEVAKTHKVTVLYREKPAELIPGMIKRPSTPVPVPQPAGALAVVAVTG